MLGDKRFIRTLQLRNLLSFGPDTPPIELGALNVLIGPNGSGKSNIIEAIDLLRASATDLAAPVRAGGGTQGWLWKGVKPLPVASINATVLFPDGQFPLSHRISFTSVGQTFELIDESIEDKREESEREQNDTFYYRYNRGHPLLTRSIEDDKDADNKDNRRIRKLRSKDFNHNDSVLAQRRASELYPEITFLGDQYKQLMLYREWNTGSNSALRNPQPVDQPNHFLAEDASNLGLVLNYLERTGDIKDTLNAHLSGFYDQYKDYTVSVEGGTVQVFLREKNLRQSVPATRLSDGTLRFLCLASILCHPNPPPLICLEEPEIGLHPDILPAIAEMLIEASQRTQVIVTTHSDIIVDALSHVPEAVLVCEKESNATSVRRLDQDALRRWLEKYSLGDLWRSGQLGGNRW